MAPSPPPDLPVPYRRADTPSKDGLPGYVEAPFDPSVPVPGALQHSRFYSVMVTGQKDRIQRLLDHFLNNPQGARLREREWQFTAVAPAGIKPRLLFVVQECFLTSTEPQLGELGFATYAEATFVVPCFARKKGELLPKIFFFMPYIWVNQAQGMASGRETWGYRKTIADIAVPRAAPSRVGNMRVRALAQLRGERSTQATTDLVYGHIPQPSWGPPSEAAQPVQPPDALQLIEGVARELVGASPDDPAGPSIVYDPPDAQAQVEVDVMQAILPAAGPPSITVANLKQIRDSGHTRKACYQAIVASPIVLGAVRGIPSVTLSPTWLTVAGNTVTYDFAADLGVLTDVQLTPKLVTYADLDLYADPGQVLWEAGR